MAFDLGAIERTRHIFAGRGWRAELFEPRTGYFDQFPLIDALQMARIVDGCIPREHHQRHMAPRRLRQGCRTVSQRRAMRDGGNTDFPGNMGLSHCHEDCATLVSRRN